MSLQVDDDRRGRSRSPGRRRRSRSPGVPQMESREPSYAYPEDDLDYRNQYAPSRRGDGVDMPGAPPEPPGAYQRGQPPSPGGVPYPEDEGLFPGSQDMYGYDDRRAAGYGGPPSPGGADQSYRGSREQVARADEFKRSSRDQYAEDPYRDPRDSRDPRESRNPNSRDSWDPRDSRDPRDYRNSRDSRDPRDPREYRDPRDSRDPRDYRDPRDQSDLRDPRDPRETRRERLGAPPVDDEPPKSPITDDKLKFLPAKYSRNASQVPENREPEPEREGSEREKREKRRSQRYLGDDDQADKRSSRPRSPRPESPPQYKYAEPRQYEYANVDDRQTDYSKRSENGQDADLAYGREPQQDKYGRRDASPNPASRYSRRDANPDPDYSSSRQNPAYGADPRESSASANVLTVEPKGDRRRSSSRVRDRSPQPPTQRMSSLSVATAAPAGASLAAAPGSPLLESYHGTYQDMSPMPSPMLLPTSGGAPLMVEPVSPIASDDERGGRRRRARFHDGSDVAERLAQALKGHRKDSPPETGPLVEILPGLSHEQVMELRKDYKTLVKTGADRKGVNIAKHIRSRLKDADPNLMKACYAVALGRWESEAYWANFWYQGDKTRRELLIESLMGRTNEEIRNIKEAFSDKKYNNSLVNCMKTELKEDKFKKAVLMVLDEKRMEDFDHYGRPLPLDYRLVDQDVDDLRRAVKSERGGESAMIAIVVQRSDAHLREVLKTYEKDFRSNFARDSLKKSGNLVGELLAHILNGIINKPVRDALLLNHALTTSRKDGLRRELLISRLVRFHWDASHMEAVKRAYRDRYGMDLKEAVREGSSGEWGWFCYELCIHRMPDHVQRFDR